MEEVTYKIAVVIIIEEEVEVINLIYVCIVSFVESLDMLWIGAIIDLFIIFREEILFNQVKILVRSMGDATQVLPLIQEPI